MCVSVCVVFNIMYFMQVYHVSHSLNHLMGYVLEMMSHSHV